MQSRIARLTIVCTLALLAPSAVADQLLNQPPNQTSSVVADSTFPNSEAEDFVLTAQTSIVKITIWGTYDGNVPAAVDDFTVIFHEDVAGLPGPVANGGTAIRTNVVPTLRAPTGNLVGAALDEYEFRLRFGAVVLNPGTYWVEIFQDAGDGGLFGWEFGDLDVVRGRLDHAFAGSTPGAFWSIGGFGNDLAIVIEGGDPLLVELASFDAVPTPDGVRITWTTASETDNAGFRLIRAQHQPADGRRTKAAEVALHPGLIPPAATSEGSGADYRFVDDAPLDAGVYLYYLEDVDLLGKVHRHGPAIVTIGRGRRAPRR